MIFGNSKKIKLQRMESRDLECLLLVCKQNYENEKDEPYGKWYPVIKRILATRKSRVRMGRTKSHYLGGRKPSQKVRAKSPLIIYPPDTGYSQRHNPSAGARDICIAE